jgi:hypothetical protein
MGSTTHQTRALTLPHTQSDNGSNRTPKTPGKPTCTERGPHTNTRRTAEPQHTAHNTHTTYSKPRVTGTQAPRVLSHRGSPSPLTSIACAQYDHTSTRGLTAGRPPQGQRLQCLPTPHPPSSGAAPEEAGPPRTPPLPDRLLPDSRVEVSMECSPWVCHPSPCNLISRPCWI